MNVIDNRFDSVPLHSIKGGGIFEFNSKLFMRVVVPAAITLDELSLKEKPTCIEVETGRLATIGWNVPVSPIVADLIINRRVCVEDYE